MAERLGSLRLPGMKAAFLSLIARRDLGDMPFEDRLALLIDREVADRRSRALQRRLERARLRHQDACFEEINLTRPRGLDLLVFGDWALAPIEPAGGRNLFEILDDRFGRRPVIVTSQSPVADWHRHLKDPFLADAIPDRLVHGATRLELHGASMRIDDAGTGTEP